MSTDEKITAFAFAVTVGLWIFGGNLGVNAVAAALTGLAILLVTGQSCWLLSPKVFILLGPVFCSLGSRCMVGGYAAGWRDCVHLGFFSSWPFLLGP